MVVYPSYHTLGTPLPHPALLQYTSRVHRYSPVQALDRRVAELTVSDTPVTVTRFTVGHYSRAPLITRFTAGLEEAELWAQERGEEES